MQQVIAEGNRDGEFSTFLGFEWHSSQWGDQCVVFPEDHRPLFYTSDPEALRRFCIDERALMIPHHLAYPKGCRGVNWDMFREDCTPVVEIFSEHGNSEDDRGPFPFVTHTMGGRETANTARAALDAGKRFGFVASSDDHAGFPGAYGEGLMGVHAQEHARASILEAIRTRRTWALTGDRIEVEFSVEGAPMGALIDAGKRVEVAFDVRGRDELDVVEIVQDGRVAHRAHAAETPPDFSGPVQLRLEWGWGPWGALALERVCDWQMRVQLSRGRIRRFFPYLSSMPFDEQRRHRFERLGETGLAIRSYTSRRNAYRENPNQSVVLELETDADAELALVLTEPVAQTASARLADLARGSLNLFTGPFPKEGWQWHRVIPLAASSVAGRAALELPDGRSSYLYLRARQRNGHMAWASPVFMNYR